MTLEEARVRLRLTTGGNSDPCLTDAELDQVLIMARRPDPDGVLVDEADYVPTWDLNWARVEAWEAKAAKASEYLSGSVGGGQVAFEQIYEHCTRQADRAKRSLNSTMTFSA